MKTMGLIGGMSWESSLEYYRIINETIKKRLSGFHSAKSVIYSVDFDVIEKMQFHERAICINKGLMWLSSEVSKRISHNLFLPISLLYDGHISPKIALQY